MTAANGGLSFDFGAQGITGNRNTNAGDGYYKIGLDLDGNGSFETEYAFYRLLGDVNGDRIVTSADDQAILAAFAAYTPKRTPTATASSTPSTAPLRCAIWAAASPQACTWMTKELGRSGTRDGVAPSRPYGVAPSRPSLQGKIHHAAKICCISGCCRDVDAGAEPARAGLIVSGSNLSLGVGGSGDVEFYVRSTPGSDVLDSFHFTIQITNNATGTRLAFVSPLADTHLSDPSYLFFGDSIVTTSSPSGLLSQTAYANDTYSGGDGTLSGLGVVVPTSDALLLRLESDHADGLCAQAETASP